MDTMRNSLADTRNPDDAGVIVDYFQISSDENSFQALEKSIQEYNEVLKTTDNAEFLRPIDIFSL